MDVCISKFQIHFWYVTDNVHSKIQFLLNLFTRQNKWHISSSFNFTFPFCDSISCFVSTGCVCVRVTWEAETNRHLKNFNIRHLNEFKHVPFTSHIRTLSLDQILWERENPIYDDFINVKFSIHTNSFGKVVCVFLYHNI